VIEVGMGATESIGSDRYPFTVIEVKKDGKELVLQADNYRRTDNNGLSELQTYEFTPNPEGSTTVVTLRKNGRYKRKGEPMYSYCYCYHIGERNAYQDPSF